MLLALFVIVGRSREFDRLRQLKANLVLDNFKKRNVGSAQARPGIHQRTAERARAGVELADAA